MDKKGAREAERLMGETGMGKGWTPQRLQEPREGRQRLRGAPGEKDFLSTKQQDRSGWSLRTSSSAARGQL